MTLLSFTFQEGSPLITYSGWIEGTSADALAGRYNGSFIVTNTPNATATLSFSGTAISLFGAKRGNHGNYTVELDSQPLFTGNGNSPDPGIFQTSLYEADNLGFTTHIVTLTNTPGTPGQFLDLDFVTIQRQIGQDGDTIFQAVLDDTSPSVQYSGGWQKTSVPAANNGTLSTTTQAAAQAMITFQGCCVELYGLYGNAPYSVVLDNQPPVTYQGLNADLSPTNTLLFLADGLSETGTHTVTLSNINSNNARPFSFDYAVIRSTHNISSITSSTLSPSGTGHAISSESSSSQNSTPVGGIVGGVIGGLLLGVLLVLGFVFFRRRRRRRGNPKFSMDLMEEEPKPYILSDHLESQRGSHYTQEPLEISSLHTSVVAPALPSKNRQQQHYYPRSVATSDEGSLSPQEQSEASGSNYRGRFAPSSTSGSSTTRSGGTITSSASMSRRDTKSGFSRQAQGIGESSGAPAVQEEDAGVVLDSEQAVATSTLPPAYNPEWHSDRA